MNGVNKDKENGKTRYLSAGEELAIEYATVIKNTLDPEKGIEEIEEIFPSDIINENIEKEYKDLIREEQLEFLLALMEELGPIALDFIPAKIIYNILFNEKNHQGMIIVIENDCGKCCNICPTNRTCNFPWKGRV